MSQKITANADYFPKKTFHVCKNTFSWLNKENRFPIFSVPEEMMPETRRKKKGDPQMRDSPVKNSLSHSQTVINLNTINMN